MKASQKSKTSKSASSNASTKKTPRKANVDNVEQVDITQLIIRDHEPIKEMLVTLKDPDVSVEERETIYAEFETLLMAHAQAEEESLYVHMKEQDKLRTEGLEGDTEHAIAAQLMKEIDQVKDDEDTWTAKVKVLAELVEHHVQEEEEVLEAVRNELDAETRIEIGKEYLSLLAQSGDQLDEVDDDNSNFADRSKEPEELRN